MFCQQLISSLLLTFFIPLLAQNRDQIPLDAPTNLTLLEIKGRQVVIEWDPVEPRSVRGSFRGYLVRTWNHVGSQVYAFPPDVTKVNIEFFPYSRNFITVSSRNEKYVGPPSEALSFDAPQIEPNLPYVLSVFALSDKSVLLHWSKPTQPNGILVGYKIYCGEINQTLPQEKFNEISYQINDPEKMQAKLTGLQVGKRYLIGVSALNCMGESDIQRAEVTLQSHIALEPSKSKFVYKINYTVPKKDELCNKPLLPSILAGNDEEGSSYEEVQLYDYFDYINYNDTKKNQVKASEIIKPTQASTDYEKGCLVDFMVLWIPDVRNIPGEHFYLKYRIKGEKEFQVTDPEKSEDFIIIHNYDACRNYEIVLTSVDGDYSTDSDLLVTPTQIL